VGKNQYFLQQVCFSRKDNSKSRWRIYKGLDSSFDDMAYRPLAFFAEKAPVSSFCMT
jgi:hypothetical protein